MSLFNLYNEIEKEYENLIPLKQEGLVLFHLYQRQKDGNIGKEFSEEEIIKSLREIRYDLKPTRKSSLIIQLSIFKNIFYGVMRITDNIALSLLQRNGVN